MKTNVIEIKVNQGLARIWEARRDSWSFALPDGTEGYGYPSAGDAIEAAEYIGDGELDADREDSAIRLR